MIDGRLDFERLARCDDAAAEAELRCSFCTASGDRTCPPDIGLLRGAQSALALKTRPTPAELSTRAERWRPLRSYAAALLRARARDSRPRN